MNLRRSQTATSVRLRLESVRHSISEMYDARTGGEFTSAERGRYRELVVAEKCLLNELRADTPADY